jgi:hypothetical protein
MTLIAGIDVGNSTTEVVLTDTADPPVPIAWDRAPTRGRKGSATSWEHAAHVLQRLERASGKRAEHVVATHQIPVDTVATFVPEPPVRLWPLVILTDRTGTPGRPGFGLGRPADLAGPPPPPGVAVVVVVGRDLDFRPTVVELERWHGRGVDIRGVALAGDEAVLVANRLSLEIPIIDEVNADQALRTQLLGVEVAPFGHVVTRLTDPYRLTTDFGFQDRDSAGRLAGVLAGRRAALVGLRAGRQAPPEDGAGGPWVEFAAAGDRVPLLPALRQIRDTDSRPVAWAPERDRLLVRDLFGIDLGAVAAEVWTRTERPGAVVAALAADNAALADPSEVLGVRTGRRISLIGSETEAARFGALSTPGTPATATVLDIGGGTIDAMGAATDHRSCAGGGDLLTLSVATVLDIPRGAADWVKRGPAGRLSGPHVLVGEDGERHFLNAPAGPDAVGALVVAGPAGLLPFHRRLEPAAWRALRLKLKLEILGANVRRALSDISGRDLILVGGPAGDEELLAALTGALPGMVLGRGNVAGVLGNRWAVAYGLTSLAVRRD